MELVESDQGPGCAESKDAEWPVGALPPPRVRLWFWVTSLSFVSLLEAAVVLWSSGWKPPPPRPLSGHLWAVLSHPPKNLASGMEKGMGFCLCFIY